MVRKRFRKTIRKWEVSLDFCIQTDHVVEDQTSDLVVVDKKVKHCKIFSFSFLMNS